MVSTIIRQPAHLPLAAPRGATWAADFALAVYRLFERVGANRARRTLRAEADKWQSIDPQRAGVMRSAQAHLTRQLETPGASASASAGSSVHGERASRSAIF